VRGACLAGSWAAAEPRPFDFVGLCISWRWIVSAVAERLTLRMASPVQADAAAKLEQPSQPVVPEDKKSIGDYFQVRPLPWWICFFGGIFLLTKFQLVYNDSPCSILGTQGPVDSSDIKRAFRTLSMCTHPDRLRGRLGHDPSPAELRRGEILFNRASAAKDLILRSLKMSKKKNDGKIACYEGELELAVLEFVTQVGRAMSALGIGDVFGFFKDTAWNVITFESGFLNTVLMCLWFMFIFRVGKQFFLYLWRMGLLRGVLALVTTVIIGPIPTLVYFIFLPVIRLVYFAKNAFARPEAEKKDENNADPGDVADPSAAKKNDDLNEKKKDGPSSANVAVATDSREIPRNIRQRKKKETDEEKEKKNKELLSGGNEAAALNAAGADPTFGAGPMPQSVLACIQWGHKQPLKAREAAATAVQFDLLLILTKPIIPLCMLLAMGQVWNGLFSSLVIGHALRRWVPQMSYEAHHLLCVFFGAMHTLLGVSASQVEDHANREGTKLLHLSWAWSFKDVLAVMHMALLGSTVTAMSALGNEPSYAASFAAGLSLRIALAQDSVKGLGLISVVGQKVEALLRDLNIQIDSAEEVVAFSGGGIGDCAGGPFRMLFGEDFAFSAAMVMKVWLMLVPLLAMMQWFQRTYHAGKMLGRRNKSLRFVQRLVLFSLGALQCYMIANLELNASNGALVNFWLAMLFGCVGESLMSTYDIRGSVRQLVFLLLFLVI